MSENKGEEALVEQANLPTVDSDEERFLRVLSRLNTKPHFTPLKYDGKLDSDQLMDWILEMEKYFNFESIVEERKVKYVFTRLKGCASLWWEHLQVDRKRRGKEKIKTWDQMTAKLK